MILDFSGQSGKEIYLSTNERGHNHAVSRFQYPAGDAAPGTRLQESTAVITRGLTIADYQNRLGRSNVMLLNGAHWNMPVTERPVLNSTETWSFINLTDDSHPIRLHLVRFQLLDRRPFDLAVYQLTKKIVLRGPAVELPAGDLGWKDTVRVDPMTITRIIVKSEAFAGKYVWHCHMLEHEDNEMMRPYIITESPPGKVA